MHSKSTSIDWSSQLGSEEDLSLLDGLTSRRSVHPRRLTDPGPGHAEIHQIVAAAVTAADHGRLRPWRFIAITGDARIRLGETFVEIKRGREGDVSVSELERERDRARSVPVLIAVISRLITDHPAVPVTEQYASLGATIQNMLLCAHGLGFGAKMVSGRKVQDPKLAFAFNLAPTEAVFGFLCIGTTVPGTSRKARVPVEEVLTHWNPDIANEESELTSVGF